MSLYLIFTTWAIKPDAKITTTAARIVRLVFQLLLFLSFMLYLVGGSVISVISLNAYHSRNSTWSNSTVNGTEVVCQDYVFRVYDLWLLAFSIQNLIFTSLAILYVVIQKTNLMKNLNTALKESLIFMLGFLELFSLGWASYGIDLVRTASYFQYCNQDHWNVFYLQVVFSFTLLLAIQVFNIGLLAVYAFLLEHSVERRHTLVEIPVVDYSSEEGDELGRFLSPEEIDAYQKTRVTIRGTAPNQPLLRAARQKWSGTSAKADPRLKKVDTESTRKRFYIAPHSEFFESQGLTFAMYLKYLLHISFREPALYDIDVIRKSNLIEVLIQEYQGDLNKPEKLFITLEITNFFQALPRGSVFEEFDGKAYFEQKHRMERMEMMASVSQADLAKV